MYSITDDGRKKLLDWLSEELKETARIPLLMKTFFLGERSVEENIEFFNRLKESYKMRYEGFVAADTSSKEYGDELQDGYRSMFWGFTISFGRRRAKMIMEWCDECIAALRNGGSR